MGIIRIVSATLMAAMLWCVSGTPAATAQFHRQAAPQINALFLGDSYSVGVGATPWTNGFVYKVSEHYDWRVFNYAARAVGYLKGDTETSLPKLSHCLSPQGCPHLIEQFEIALQAGVSPDIVFVSGGRNDAPGATFEAAVQALLDDIQLKAPHAKIFVTSPISYGPEQKVMADKVQIVRDACRDRHVTFIELGAPLLTHTGLLYRDQIHPSNRGHQLLANKIIKRIDSEKPNFGF